MRLDSPFTVIRRAKWSCDPAARVAFPTGGDNLAELPLQVLPAYQRKASPSIKKAGYMEPAVYEHIKHEQQATMFDPS